MKKIVSLFQRNYDGDRQVRDEVVPAAAWVAAGEGMATRKWDGMAVMVADGQVYKRYDAKAGRTPPADFMPAQPAADEATGHWPGWVPAAGPDTARILEGIEWGVRELFAGGPVPDGTYEVSDECAVQPRFSPGLPMAGGAYCIMADSRPAPVSIRKRPNPAC